MSSTTPTERQILVTPRDAAGMLGISERTLWAMKESGQLPHVRIGRSVRYRIVDLEAWAASQASRVGGLEVAL